jgi:DNA-binding transcriptional regulator YiaG
MNFIAANVVVATSLTAFCFLHADPDTFVHGVLAICLLGVTLEVLALGADRKRRGEWAHESAAPATCYHGSNDLLLSDWSAIQCLCGNVRRTGLSRCSLRQRTEAKMMSPSQYKSARRTLGLTHEELAEILGKSTRMVFRYQEIGIKSDTTTRLLRLLVRLKLTVPEDKFEEIVEKL